MPTASIITAASINTTAVITGIIITAVTKKASRRYGNDFPVFGGSPYGKPAVIMDSFRLRG